VGATGATPLVHRGALTPPKSVAGIVDDANGRHLLRNVQSNKMGIDQPPTVRITGRHRPDRGTIGGSGANRDYRMSTYELCTPARVSFFHAEMRNARVHKFFPVSLVSHTGIEL
jgi:hypothetical protein